MPAFTVRPLSNTIEAKPPVPNSTPDSQYVRNVPMKETGMRDMMASGSLSDSNRMLHTKNMMMIMSPNNQYCVPLS